MDATDVVAAIVAAGVVIALVGNAKLIMQAGVKAFAWVRSVL